MLLEDLGDRTMISQIAGVPGTRAAEALRTLARLHGTWWSSPLLDELDWMPRLDEPINLAAGQQYRDAWPVFLERIGDDLGPEALELGERHAARVRGPAPHGIDEAPVTVCHGDFRADNLMFDDRADPDDEVAVLDWQISYRGPGHHRRRLLPVPVAHRRGAPRRTRPTWSAAGTTSWPTTVLREQGTTLDDYPFDLAWEQYRRASLGTTVYAVSAMGAMDVANERGPRAGDVDGRAVLHRRPRPGGRRPAPLTRYRAWWRRRPGRGQSKLTSAPVPESVT